MTACPAVAETAAALEHSELVGLAEALRHHGHKAGAGPAA
jgi:hypothetical protein